MAIKLSSGFEILYLSDLAFEGMTVELQYHGEQIAQLNMDGGAEHMEVHLLGPPFIDKKFEQRFPLNEFLEAASSGEGSVIGIS